MQFPLFDVNCISMHQNLNNEDPWLKEMVSNGADSALTDNDGYSALHVAAAEGEDQGVGAALAEPCTRDAQRAQARVQSRTRQRTARFAAGCVQTSQPRNRYEVRQSRKARQGRKLLL